MRFEIYLIAWKGLIRITIHKLALSMTKNYSKLNFSLTFQKGHSAITQKSGKFPLNLQNYN